METMPGRNGGTLRRIPKGVSGNPAGRAPKLVTGLVKDLKAAGYERVTAAVVAELFEQLIGLPEKELERLKEDASQPLSVRIMARSMLSSKGMQVMETMLDRAHGKAKQSVDLAATVTTPPVLNILVHSKPDGQ